MVSGKNKNKSAQVLVEYAIISTSLVVALSVFFIELVNGQTGYEMMLDAINSLISSVSIIIAIP